MGSSGWKRKEKVQPPDLFNLCANRLTGSSRLKLSEPRHSRSAARSERSQSMINRLMRREHMAASFQNCALKSQRLEWIQRKILKVKMLKFNFASTRLI